MSEFEKEFPITYQINGIDDANGMEETKLIDEEIKG